MTVPGLDVDRLRFVRIQGPNGPLGTGFRLSARRVLTGHHVVQGKERFWVLDPDPEDTRKWLGSEDSLATIAWAPDGDAKAEDALDAALLETDEVKGIRPFTRLLDREVSTTVSWEGCGYPATAAKTPEDLHPLEGGTGSLQRNPARLVVTVQDGLPEKPAGWKGISGAPIFARTPAFSGWTLVALLRKTFVDFGTGRIQAVSLPALLAESEFREALELPEGRQRCSALIEKATALLQRERLAEEVAACNERWQAARETEGVDGLAKAICLHSDLATIAGSLVDVYCDLMDRPSLDDAGAVLDLLYCALSASYLNGVGGKLPGREATEVELDVTTAILAEIANAAIDAGPVALTTASPGQRKLARSPFDLTEFPEELPEAGIDPEGKQRLKDLRERLRAKLALASDTGSLKAEQEALAYIVEVAIARREEGHATFFPDSYLDHLESANPLERRRAVSKVINGRLAREAERGRRYYLIADARTPEGRSFLDQLREQLPDLRRALTNRSPEGLPERLAAEDAVGDPLESLLLHQQKSRRTQEDKETP